MGYCEHIRLLNLGPFCALLQNSLTSNDFGSSCMLPISTHCLQTDADDHKRMLFIFFSNDVFIRFCKYSMRFC